MGKAKKGISRRTNFTIGGRREGDIVQGGTIGPMARAVERKNLQDLYNQAVSGLSQRSRKVLKDMDGVRNDGWSDVDDNGVLTEMIDTHSKDPMATDEETYIHDIAEIMRMGLKGSSR